MNYESKLSIGKILLGMLVTLIFIFLVIPTILAVPMSFTESHYLAFPPKGFSLQCHQQFFTDSKWIEPTIFSLKLASITTVVSLIIGTMASLALVRGILPGKRILHLFFLSPMMVPLIVTAFAVYGVFATFRLIGTLPGMVIAHTIIGVPYVMLVITANLYRFKFSAVSNSATNFFNNLFYCDSHWNLDQTPTSYFPSQCKNFCSIRFFRSDF